MFTIFLACRLDRYDGEEEHFIGLVKSSSSPDAATYWLDGSNSTYRVYKSGEPDDDDMCFVIKADSDVEMKDDECDDDRRYICKITGGKVVLFKSSNNSSKNQQQQ